MKKLLNNLYITSEGSYLHKERETIVVELEGKKIFQAPFHAFGGIYCFGRVMVSPALMGGCGERGIELAFFTNYGKFQARVLGPQTGNVLLRRAQYRLADGNPALLARIFVGAKLANSRQIVMKQIRNHGQNQMLKQCAMQLAGGLRRLKFASEMDGIRGIEGDSAAGYFAVFNELISAEQRGTFRFSGRTRRPPLDEVNAMLSFSYSLLANEIASALQGVGLDPYVGFLHTDRPGRLSLALDMLEEFRAWWCDRFVLTLINRKQIKRSNFVKEASGAVRMKGDVRKEFLTAWQGRKQEQIVHPFLKEKAPVGLLPHIQAMLLAKHLRGDLENYPPFFTR